MDEAGITRRDLLIKGSAALGGVIALGLRPLPALAAQPPKPRKGYEFRHAPNVQILVAPAGDPRRLDLRVRVDGVEVEHHPDVHPARLRQIRSPHFNVRWIRPPGT